MKKFLLLAVMFVCTLPVFAQFSPRNNSATMLVVRQNSTGVLTIQQALTPASFSTSPVNGITCGNDFSDFLSQDGTIPAANPPQDFFWPCLESSLIKYPGQPFPLNDQGLMMVIWQQQPGHVISLRTLADDPSITGTFVAVTSSLSTAENAIRDKLYLGL